MKRKSISTKRLEIRPYRVSDYQAWFHSYSDMPLKKSKYDRDPYPASKCGIKDFRAILARYKKMEKLDTTYVWGVFDRKSGALIGVVDVFIICRVEIQKANLGYRVFNKYWKQGYAKEFVSAGIILAFKNLKINRLEAVIDPDNRASIKLVKSLGLVNEGVRKKYYYQNGAWADQVVYTAQREDWGLSQLNPKN